MVASIDSTIKHSELQRNNFIANSTGNVCSSGQHSTALVGLLSSRIAVHNKAVVSMMLHRGRSARTVRAWPQDHSGRSPPLGKATWGPWGAQGAPGGPRVPRSPGYPGPRPLVPLKANEGRPRASHAPWAILWPLKGPETPGTQDHQGTLENSKVDLGRCCSCTKV